MKQALIIGGSTGMGRATAEILLQQGIEVAIVARANKSLEATEKELTQMGRVKVYGIDLAKPDEVNAFIKQLPNEF